MSSIESRGRPVMLRLMEMGLLPGATVRVRKRAPFRGPLELWVGGYLLSIRSSEARELKVTPVADHLERPIPVTTRRSSEASDERASGVSLPGARDPSAARVGGTLPTNEVA